MSMHGGAAVIDWVLLWKVFSADDDDDDDDARSDHYFVAQIN
jgi:hypothetical protein